MSEQPHYPGGFENEQNPLYPQNPQYAQVPQQYHPQPQEPKGMAITALVLGILAVVLSIVPILAVPMGVAAIILGAISVRKNIAKGMSIAGIITGSIGLLISIALFVFTFMALQALNDSGEIRLDFGEEIERSLEDYNDGIRTETDTQSTQLQGT